MHLARNNTGGEHLKTTDEICTKGLTYRKKQLCAFASTLSAPPMYSYLERLYHTVLCCSRGQPSSIVSCFAFGIPFCIFSSRYRNLCLCSGTHVPVSDSICAEADESRASAIEIVVHGRFSAFIVDEMEKARCKVFRLDIVLFVLFANPARQIPRIVILLDYCFTTTWLSTGSLIIQQAPQRVR